MILVVDVGNTNITCGVYGEREMKATFRMTTKTPRTSDEYGVMMTQLLAARELKPSLLKALQWPVWCRM